MKRYNNLFDSILMTILTISIFFMGVCSEYFSVIVNENDMNKVGISFINCSIYGIMTILGLFVIFKYCFEKWWIEEKQYVLKNCFVRQLK